MKILVVDDVTLNRELLQAALEGKGHTLFLAENGIEALEILERESVDAVISDILMPRMDGYRLCHEIRHREALKHLPFIHYTSTYTTPDDEQLSKTVGADGYLTKPAPTDVLLRVLEKATDRAGRGTAPALNASGTAFVMKEYSVALVKKLEEKNRDLERAMGELREAHQALVELNGSLERRVQERTAELEASNHRLQAALTEVKELSGLLPICSWCKKIRDGEEYWHRVEDYICQRTRAEFSHSICPECFSKQSPHWGKT